MFKEITIRRISAGTLFKLTGLGLSLSIVPFALLMGVFALFGVPTVNWNGQPLTGMAGLIASPFIGLFITGIFTMLLGACMAFGLFLYSLARPISLLIKAVDNEVDA